MVSDSTSRPRQPRRRWLWVTLVATVFGVATYCLAVLTTTGQTIENAALRGADQVSAVDVQDADAALGRITVYSLFAAIVVVALIALVRRQVVLAVAAVSVVVVGQIVTQTLKRFVLPRPELVSVTGDYAHNSLPSGHTTIAMTVLFALLMVVPFRVRGVVMFFALTWAVGIGAYTVTAKWHRLSDTLVADAVALVVACVASLMLWRAGRIRVVGSVPAHRLVLRSVFVTVVALVGAVALVTGVTLAALTPRDAIDDVAEYNYFLAAQTLASAGSIVAALVFWWTWHRIETVRR